MNKTATALIFKLLMTFILAWLTFGFMDGNTLGWIFLVSLIGAAVNYLVGDLLVLPSFGNITASISDGIMATLTAYIISLISIFTVTFTSLLIFAVLITVGEYFFHNYLGKSNKVAP